MFIEVVGIEDVVNPPGPATKPTEVSSVPKNRAKIPPRIKNNIPQQTRNMPPNAVRTLPPASVKISPKIADPVTR